MIAVRYSIMIWMRWNESIELLMLLTIVGLFARYNSLGIVIMIS